MQTMGYSAIRAGNILMMMSLGGIVGAPLGGRLSDRVFLSRKKVVMGGMCAYGLGLLFLVLGIVTRSHWRGNIVGQLHMSLTKQERGRGRSCYPYGRFAYKRVKPIDEKSKPILVKWRKRCKRD